jgi:hypothetical protein
LLRIISLVLLLELLVLLRPGQQALLLLGQPVLLQPELLALLLLEQPVLPQLAESLLQLQVLLLFCCKRSKQQQTGMRSAKSWS